MFEAGGKANILWAEPGGGVWAEPRAPSPPARGSAAALPRGSAPPRAESPFLIQRPPLGPRRRWCYLGEQWLVSSAVARAPPYGREA